jgi:hypothetical protein
MNNANVTALLSGLFDREKVAFLTGRVVMPRALSEFEEGHVTRIELAHAMNLALFEGLLASSSNARQYTDEVIAAGDSIHFDHGAIRTVLWSKTGELPPGEAAFARILRPLGFRLNGRYPLDRLGMIGRAYAHDDAPNEVAQFFVSELYPERFSDEFQRSVTNVLSSSKDPLTPLAMSQLWALEREGWLPLDVAAELLPVIVSAFGCHHDLPSEADYQTLLKESAEMAWIATEGNAFNHATDRVDDVFKLSEQQKEKGRPMKPDVERSRSGRVFQTAYVADTVQRRFRSSDGGVVTREVPGSFYEFITRKRFFDQTSRCWQTDLRFDAGNATAIFKMTSSAVTK